MTPSIRWNFREIGWRLLPGCLAGLMTAGFWQLGALKSLEWAAYCNLFRLRGALPTDERVVMVAIDEPSIKQLGRFPWSRNRYAELLRILQEAKASIIAFDLLWSEPSPEDHALAAAMTKYDRVVLAEAWDSSGTPLIPVPELRSRAIATGHILKHEDPDGITRYINLQLQGEPALALAVVQAYSLVDKPVTLPDLKQPYWINWAGKNMREYSFVDVIQGKVSPESFQNKIVLVGVTASGIDSLSTPFHSNPPASGVYLQAEVINNLLQQNGLRIPSPLWSILLIYLGAPGFGLLLSYWQTRGQLIAGVGICLAWGVFSLGLLHLNYLPTVALPIVLFATTTTAVGLCERLRMNQLLKKQIDDLWQAHYHDLMLLQPGKMTGKGNQKLVEDDYSPNILPYPPSPFPISMQKVNQLAVLAQLVNRLNQQLLERTAQLEATNQELEAFNYTVSHDLTAPLWRIHGFSNALSEDYGERLDDIGRDYLQRIQVSAQRMDELIQDLLKLSRITANEIYRETINLSELVIEVANTLSSSHPDRSVELLVAPGIIAEGDRRLLKIALENLLSNAWKFTSKCAQAQIEFGAAPPSLNSSSQPLYFLRDNGIGFDMKRIDCLFNAFQRLPNAKEFPGNGIGLMIVQRIIHRHGGRIWAEAQVEQGATFYFILS